jgi:hypothetical protein
MSASNYEDWHLFSILRISWIFFLDNKYIGRFIMLLILYIDIEILLKSHFLSIYKGKHTFCNIHKKVDSFINIIFKISSE